MTNSLVVTCVSHACEDDMCCEIVDAVAIAYGTGSFRDLSDLSEFKIKVKRGKHFAGVEKTLSKLYPTAIFEEY